jgi:hypothetical protein
VLQTERFILNKEIVEIQLDLLWNFTRSLAYYRAIQQDLRNIESNKEFWVNTMNAHYLRAITDWCIVFGSDSNAAHWKKLTSDEKEKIKLEVRPLILSAAKLTQNEWAQYHQELTGFRNEYASHRNVNFTGNIPCLDIAYEIAKSYFEWLKQLLRLATNEPKPLAVLFPETQIEILNVLNNDLKKI